MSDQSSVSSPAAARAVSNNGRPAAAVARPTKRLSDFLKKKAEIKRGYRVMVHGLEGIGKTRFACNAPDPVFIGVEDGFGDMDEANNPQVFHPNWWTEVIPFLRTLLTDPHQFKTIVFDTIDWIESMVMEHLKKQAGVTSMNEGTLAFGGGTTQLLDEWRSMFSVLDQLREVKGMHVVFLCHTKLAKFENPSGLDYERYVPLLTEKTAGRFRQYCDVVMYAAYETYVKGETKKSTKGKAFGNERVLNTVWTPAWDAKNRYSLPEKLPLSWAEFWHAMNPSKDDLAAKCEVLRKQIRQGTQSYNDPARTAKVEEFLTAIGNDVAPLEECLNNLTTRLAEAARQADIATKQEAQEQLAQAQSEVEASAG